MKRVWPYLALGIGAYLLFTIVTLPASLILSRVNAQGIYTAGVEGTVWKGKAQVVQLANANLGSVDWNLHFFPLLTGRLKADVQLTRTDGFARTTVAAAPSGRVHLSELSASLPLSALPAGGVAGGWSGLLNLKMAHLELHQGWPIAAEGMVEANDLTGPANRPTNIGSYKLVFPGEAAAKPEDPLTASLTDLSGPIQVNGTLQLRPDRNYFLECFVALRPGAPTQIANALQVLGPPDPQGRRRFATEGSY